MLTRRTTAETLPASSTTPEAATMVDVMSLRHLTDHPRLHILIVRRHDIQARLGILAEEHRQVDAQLRDLSATEAEQVAVLGTQWSPAKLRELKVRLADIETEETTLGLGLQVLDDHISEAKEAVWQEVEEGFNALRRPLVNQIMQALEGITDANKQLHAIEALAQRVLGVGRWHLVDGQLPQRLDVMRRTQRLLNGADASRAAVA